MAGFLQNKDDIGHILVQVQDDLKQLKKNLAGMTVQESGEIVDIEVLDTAISRTEDGIRRRAEEYLKTINKQVLTLPCIEDPEKKTSSAELAIWEPPLKTIPNTRPQKYQIPSASPGEKHKSALMMRLLHNPFHPKNRELVHQSYGIQLPYLDKRAGVTVGTQRMVTGPTAGSSSITAGDLPKLLCPKPPLSEEDINTDGSEKAGQWYMDVNREVIMDHSRFMAEGLSSSSRTIRTPPPSAASKSSESRGLIHRLTRLTPLTPQSVPMLLPNAVGKYPFTIAEGQIDPCAPDYCRFKEHYCLCWGAIMEVLGQLQHVLLDFAVPQARVCGERLAACVQSGELDGRDSRDRCGQLEKLLSVLENRNEVWDVMCQPGRRYKGRGGEQAAAVRIQSCWRRYTARAAYLLQLQRKWAAQTIAMSLLKRTQLGHLRKSLEVSRRRHLENYRIRAEYLAANWKHITSSKKTIIHVPSLGYSKDQRVGLRGFDILQNSQMGRLCDMRDENVEVIYVSPVSLGEDLLQYYTHLLGLQTVVELGDASAHQAHCAKRFTILTPEALEYFPTRNMCLATLLKYSPRTLKRIKNLIQGKQAYMISGVTHIDDLAVADELEVPLLGTEPGVAQLYGTKSGGRRIFSSAGVTMPPGKWDIYTLEQLHEGLVQLMIEHMEVQRWLFKIDGEMGGRGTAYCDVCHLRCRPWAQREFSRHGPEHWKMLGAQEPLMIKFIEEVPHLLAHHARPVNTSRYSTWACFLEHFLREGGIIEAYPPSDSVTCLTVDLLVDPGGDVHMLSCGDQLRGPSGLEVVGCSMPQTSVCPDVLHSICTRVGQACHQRFIMGHLSLDLVTFLEPSNLKQQVWAIDLDLGYSNQLAMTQLMLMMTGGTLDCRTSKLEVPPPIKDPKPSLRQARVKRKAQTSVTSRFAVMGSRLIHTNLSFVYYSTFFLMCKAQGIGYDVKERQGTVFAPHDSRDRRSLGMLTISENLQGALLTFARNLSVIHQEISTPNMQGMTNFKDLIKDIEEVLGMTIQNQTKTQEEEEITETGSEQLSSHTPHKSTQN